jgi:hypothetical protein
MLHVFRDSGFPVTTRTIPGVVLVELPTSLSPQETTGATTRCPVREAALRPPRSQARRICLM